MKNGTCPNCGSSEIIPSLRVFAQAQVLAWVEMVEPEPANRAVVWKAGFELGRFHVEVCGACGYSEMFADNYKGMNEGHRKVYKSK